MRAVDLQTQVAVQVRELAHQLNDAFQRVRIAPGEYAPELTEPEGPSTSKGAHALQHLRLVPKMAGMPTLVIGQVNKVEGTAELRTYEHLDVIHKERFGKPLELNQMEYEGFVDMAKSFLAVHQIATTLAGPPPPPDPSIAPPERERTRGMILGFVVGALVASIATTLIVWLLVR